MSEATIHLTSAHAPNGVGEHWWETEESVCAVPEDLAKSLLRNPGGGYSVAEPYKALPQQRPKKAPTPEPEQEEEPVTTPEPNSEGPMAEALDLVKPVSKARSARKAA